MASFDDVVRMSSQWPEVSVSTSYATPALKVRGKSFCRLWGERDRSKSDIEGDVLVVFCELDEKEFLLSESDGSIFTAPHYDGYGAVLIHLDEIDEELLTSILLESYLLKAPASIRRQFPDPAI
ncbi:MAG: MmcQ/YjbR family DNA-binding protein [Acidimicrobiales bacterium]|jgi:hypothetical protein